MSTTPPSIAASPASPSNAVNAPASPLASSTSVDYKWYLPSATPSYVLQSFLKHTQPRSLRGRSKEYLTAFAKYYFSRKPSLSPAELHLLLFGDGERRGLIEACGALKGIGGTGELRGSAVLSLELLLMLLDVNVNTAHGEEVLDVLVKAQGQALTPRLLQSMRLDKHLAQAASSDYALKLIFIVSESCASLQGRDEWIGSAEGVRHYDQWLKAHLQAQHEAQALAAAEDDDRELTRWDQVKLEDLDAEDLQVDAALAELIAEVDAEAEKEGGQKDPLGIARTLPPAGGAGASAEVQASAKIGKAAAQKMKILWKQMTKLKPQQPQQLQHAPSAGEAAGAAASSGSTASSVASVSSSGSLDLMKSVMPQGSTSTDREDFNPTLFLSQVHASSSLDALQRGLLHLQRSVNNRAAAMKSLVAEHFGQYVFCLDTIEHLHQLMQSEVLDSKSRALRISQSLAELNRQCDEAFGALIGSKKDSDRMRETLDVLRNYEFLFALPGEVAQHAHNKQYAQVVRLYKKAKAITIQQASSRVAAASPSSASPAATDLPSLVLHEVFLSVSAVRSALFRQLASPHVSLDEQVRAIQFLVDLDCDVDPAWYFLQRQRQSVGQQMEGAVLSAIERMTRRGGGPEENAAQPRTHHKRGSSSRSFQSLSPPGSPRASSLLSAQGELPGMPQSNGHSAAPSSPLLIAPWNPFGALLAINPAVAPSCAAPSSPSASPLSSSASSSTAWPVASSALAWSDAAVASAVHHLLHRLCALINQALPAFLNLAQLIATRQLTAHGSISAGAAGDQKQASAAPLQGVSAEHRQAIHALVDGLFHQFSAYVRLALFPVSREQLQQWEQQWIAQKGAQGPASPALRPLASPKAASTSPSSPSALPLIDKAAEHAPFSLDAAACSPLPLLSAPSGASPLPLPPSMWQNVHSVLRSYVSMQELGLSAESLHELSGLRSAVIRWYTAQLFCNARAAIEGLKEMEDWTLVTVNEGGGTRRSAGEPAAASAFLRRTSLPSRFQSVVQALLSSLAAIPSVKATWIVKLIAGPTMDCMKAFAHTLHALREQHSGAEDDEPDTQPVLPSPFFPGNAQRSLSVRLLLLLTNLRYTRAAVLPGLLAQLLALFPVSSTHSVLSDAFTQSVLPVYSEVDAVLIQLFLRQHLVGLHRQIRSSAYERSALLLQLHGRAQSSSKEEGKARPAPLRTRGALVDVAVQLVAIHSELYYFCPPIIPQCMQALYAGAVQSILWCCQHVVEDEEDAVSFWRAHRSLRQLALLELEFLERVLERFASQEADDALDQAHAFLLSRAAQDDEEEKKAKDEDVDEDERVRAAQLNKDLAATSAMFYCFTLETEDERKAKAKQALPSNGRGHAAEERKHRGAREAADDEDDEDDDDVIEEEDEDNGDRDD